MEGRALHADEIGGARDIAAEARKLRGKIIAFESLRAPRAAASPGDARRRSRSSHGGTALPTSGGSIAAVISLSDRRPARIITRSILLRSWRTLPGQSWVCRTAIASSASLRMRLAGQLASRILAKCSIRLGNILAALGQRRHADRHDAQAMIEVLAKLARRQSGWRDRGSSMRRCGHRP